MTFVFPSPEAKKFVRSRDVSPLLHDMLQVLSERSGLLETTTITFLGQACRPLLLLLLSYFADYQIHVLTFALTLNRSFLTTLSTDSTADF